MASKKQDKKDNYNANGEAEESRAPEETQNKEDALLKEQQMKRRRRKRRRKAVIGFFIRILAMAIVVYVLFFIIVGVTVMPNADMYPRVDSGDLVIYYRLDRDVKAQDIIVFEKEMEGIVKNSGRSQAQGTASGAQTTVQTSAGNLSAAVQTSGKQQFISRVVAVAGDTVEVTEEGNLIINGSSMVEYGIFYSTYPYVGYTEYPVTLGEGECFVLADSRQGGADSRFFGPVKTEEILGTVITILRRNNL